jgi:hypothetical protein
MELGKLEPLLLPWRRGLCRGIVFAYEVKSREIESRLRIGWLFLLRKKINYYI